MHFSKLSRRADGVLTGVLRVGISRRVALGRVRVLRERRRSARPLHRSTRRDRRQAESNRRYLSREENDVAPRWTGFYVDWRIGGSKTFTWRSLTAVAHERKRSPLTLPSGESAASGKGVGARGRCIGSRTEAAGTSKVTVATSRGQKANLRYLSGEENDVAPPLDRLLR